MRNQGLAGYPAAWLGALVVGVACLLAAPDVFAQDKPYVDEWASPDEPEPPKEGKEAKESRDETHDKAAAKSDSEDEEADEDEGDADEDESEPPPKAKKKKHAKKKKAVEEDEDEEEDEDADVGTYGAIGTLVIRGSVEGFSSSRTQTADPDDISLSSTDVILAPEVGYFFSDQLELGGSLPLSFTSQERKVADMSDKVSGAGYGIGLYGLYHVPRDERSHWILGAELGYASQSTTDSMGVETTTKGWNIAARGGFELLFGSGGWGVLDIEAVARYVSLSGDMDVKISGTDIGVRTALGVAFP